MKQNETNETYLGEKGEPNYHCICCDYKCSVKFSYDKNLLTSKHLKYTQMKQNETKNEKKENNPSLIIINVSWTSLGNNVLTVLIVLSIMHNNSFTISNNYFSLPINSISLIFIPIKD